MESFIVKLNDTGKYFKSDFSVFNNVNSLKFTKNKKKATVFQPEANIIKNDRGHEFKIGQTRINEFSYLLSNMGIKKEDVTLEYFDAPEQKLTF
jgi:DNA gyrase/topoisomerase IV subunit B